MWILRPIEGLLSDIWLFDHPLLVSPKSGLILCDLRLSAEVSWLPVCVIFLCDDELWLNLIADLTSTCSLLSDSWSLRIGVLQEDIDGLMLISYWHTHTHTHIWLIIYWWADHFQHTNTNDNCLNHYHKCLFARWKIIINYWPLALTVICKARADQ